MYLHALPFRTLDECYISRGSDYRGNVSKTASGILCQNWTSQKPHKHDYIPLDYPSEGLEDSNYCRNPSGSAGPWCYTTDPQIRWMFCDIRRCSKKFRRRCISVGEYYRGSQRITKSGLLCQKWSSQIPHAHTYTPGNNPQSGLEANYCRNPTLNAITPWCYTKSTFKRWEYCDIADYLCGEIK
ncbi:uncharacterized protein TRIADDRAFT_25018 [Trichoplax adhaerens]|uniref:Kringle domain-containing protein n=1 Tax=Trichoplax adhaerens TaxID=10228 RepID=B3RYG3_TRIAD|nr:hypothetical protein TRIADDRAFT_25018 [Trichoplax adhaerens]EDV25033.1 hypothetical protein TRIADDRAFT_25018 [Trichoplax adhaerens]|eukprot:XP_002112923.1 hypothetical protein TRIADDRAFT_25018 [Trichoplax adhaerens]